MAVTITLQDLINQTSDLVGNYTTSTIDQGNTVRAINRAIEIVQRRLGLPSDKRIQNFYFYEDTPFYNLNVDFNEDIEVYYNTQSGTNQADSNTPNNRWFRVEDTEILRSTGQYRSMKRYSFTTMNGLNQLLMSGFNIRSGALIQAFDVDSGFTYSTSITAHTIDNNIYKQGTGSLMFSMSTAEGTSTITNTGVNFDIRSLLNNNGGYRYWFYFPTSGNGYLSSVNIQLTSSTGNYYQISTTTDYLGNAWASNGWSKLAFNLNNATTVGTPDASAITSIVFNFVHSGSFVTSSGWRIDDLYTVNPDYMDLVYYSNYKGTDVTGVTKKTLLDTVTDQLAFASFAPDLIMPICIKAAEILMPQLRGDLNFTQLYKQNYTETLLIMGKTWPRKRNSNAASTQIIR